MRKSCTVLAALALVVPADAAHAWSIGSQLNETGCHEPITAEALATHAHSTAAASSDAEISARRSTVRLGPVHARARLPGGAIRECRVSRSIVPLGTSSPCEPAETLQRISRGFKGP